MKFRLANPQRHYLMTTSDESFPLMTTDKSEAALFYLDEALENLSKVRSLGFEIFLDPITETIESSKISSFELSLTQLSKKQVIDVAGYLTNEFGDVSFKLTRVILSDGTSAHCEGEHDLPYLDEVPGVDDATLEKIYREQ